MQVHYGLNNFTKPIHAVVTIGTFDGVHKGHQQIINRINEIARSCGGESVILTFDPHPRSVLFPDKAGEVKLITTLEEKIGLLRKARTDHLVIYPFTKEFSLLSGKEFVQQVLVKKLGVERLVIGYNHHFGHNREGSFEQLKKYSIDYGFSVEEIPARDVDNINVSSTRIREALAKGKVDVAEKYLGYPFFITGEVVEGMKLGRKIGFPTANISVPDPAKLIPANGVYAVSAQVENKLLKGMLNIGTRPTVGGHGVVIEVHLFDFNSDLYGKPIRVMFHRRMREEIKFPTLNDLVRQLEKDRIQALELLK